MITRQVDKRWGNCANPKRTNMRGEEETSTRTRKWKIARDRRAGRDVGRKLLQYLEGKGKKLAIGTLRKGPTKKGEKLNRGGRNLTAELLPMGKKRCKI